MKYVRLVARPDLAAAPRLFRLAAAAPYVEETRLLAWNLATGDRLTALGDVHGDGARLAREVGEEDPVQRVSHTRVGPERHVLLLDVARGAVAMLEAVLGSFTRDQLIVVKPVVYRDGAVHVRFVGAADAVQGAVDELPDLIDVDVREVGDYHPAAGRAGAALSERQREAIAVAQSIGYYERPRRATHADVAAELGCAPSTASEHLQRAEAKLVRRALSPVTHAPRNA